MPEDPDIADTLSYIAEHPELFTKEEMAAKMKEGAQRIRDLRLLVGAWQKVELDEASPEGNA